MLVTVEKILPYRIIALALFITSANAVYSQDSCCYAVKGTISLTNGERLSNGVVSLYRCIDTSRLISTLTDSLGNFHYTGIPRGEYFFGLQFGRNKSKVLSQRYRIDSSVQHLRIVLNQPVQSLQEVVVTSGKPFLQRESDRLVVNLESSALTRGGSVLEAFSKLPGVEVLRGNTVVVNGNSDVLIIIDGKSYRSSSSQAVQWLQSLRSDNVEKVEIYTTPPARFDAEGASVINVVLKKDKIFSNVFFNYGQRLFPEDGEWGGRLNRLSGGGNFFYSFGQFRINARAGITSDASSYTREHYVLHFPESMRKNKSLTGSGASTGFVNITANYEAKDQVFGLSYSTNRTFLIDIDSYNEDRFFGNGSNGLYEFNSALNTRVKNVNPVWVVSYDRVLNKKKKQALSLALIAGRYRNNYDIFQRIMNLAGDDSSFFYQFQDFAVQSEAAKIDYTQEHRLFGKIEAGFKITRSGNSDDYTYVSGGTPSKFRFDENIAAVYVNTGKTLKNKISYTAGVRVERTYNNSHSSLQAGTKLRNTYTDIFPSFSLQYPLSAKSNLAFSYSRRIARPAYSNFNPAAYLVFNDPFSGQEGNMQLRPQYISRYEISFQKGVFYAALNHTHRTNIRTTFAEMVDSQRTVYRTVNVSGSNTHLLVSYQYRPSNWFESNLDMTGLLNSNKLLDNSRINTFIFRLSNNNAFTLSPTLKSNISIRYYSGFQMEYQKQKGFYVVDIGINKSLFKNRVNLTVSINDLTGSNKPRWVNKYPGLEKNLVTVTNERFFSINISYRFKTGNRFQLKRKQADEFGEIRFYK